MRQKFGELLIYMFSTIVGPNFLLIFSKLILDKTEKDLIFTFHNVCPHDMSTIINKSNKSFFSGNKF